MLVALPGGKAVGRRGTSEPRVLIPRSSMAARAGITPVAVPSNLWMSPWLLRDPAPEVTTRPTLRVVA